MKQNRPGGWVRPFGVLGILWILAFALACRLAPWAYSNTPGGDSVAERFLGASRAAFGQGFVEQADNFFHLGVPHLQGTAFTGSVYQVWAEQIGPSSHRHAEGVGVREIMPWLRLATEMDPRNVDAYLTTAYLLRTGVRRPDLAAEVLAEAQRNNPADYRVLSERARMLFSQQDDGRAAALLDAGIRLWPGGQNPTNEQARMELSQMLSYRAFLFEIQGEPRKALELFRKASALFPENAALARRVRGLERGEDFSRQDRASWEEVFGRKMTCARTEHAGAEDDDHEHGGEQDHDHAD